MLVHEIQDAVHSFVRFDSLERQVIDSLAFQRLRDIRQLALTCLVYPGATHTRFEHSLGVMELASRVFDVVTDAAAAEDDARDRLPELADAERLRYWRRVLRMAALCHDMGHAPFSHSAEDLLPGGRAHERLTAEIVRSDDMQAIWAGSDPALEPDDIVKLAVGPVVADELGMASFSDWEAVLSEMIVGDAFGADRMDYLLRDSHHIGVALGVFDYHRLTDTLRILPGLPTCDGDFIDEPMLGIEQGGLRSVEALLLARYFMFSQVYYHPVRMIYDIHLRDFLAEWLHGGLFPEDVEDYLALSDSEILTALRNAREDPSALGHVHAKRTAKREHFRVVYWRNSSDTAWNPDAVRLVYEAARDRFGEGRIRTAAGVQRRGSPDFPVRTKDGRVVSSLAASQVVSELPLVAEGYVFASPDCRQEAQEWIQANRDTILEVELSDDAS